MAIRGRAKIPNPFFLANLFEKAFNIARTPFSHGCPAGTSAKLATLFSTSF
jgi:hypothetical protein